MLLWIIILLGLASALFEFFIVWRVPVLKTWILKHLIIGILLSLVIAITLGHIFVVGGLIAFAAWLVSSAVTSTVYGVMHVLEKKPAQIQDIPDQVSFRDRFNSILAELKTT